MDEGMKKSKKEKADLTTTTAKPPRAKGETPEDVSEGVRVGSDGRKEAEAEAR